MARREQEYFSTSPVTEKNWLELPWLDPLAHHNHIREALGMLFPSRGAELSAELRRAAIERHDNPPAPAESPFMPVSFELIPSCTPQRSHMLDATSYAMQYIREPIELVKGAASMTVTGSTERSLEATVRELKHFAREQSLKPTPPHVEQLQSYLDGVLDGTAEPVRISRGARGGGGSIHVDEGTRMPELARELMASSKRHTVNATINIDTSQFHRAAAALKGAAAALKGSFTRLADRIYTENLVDDMPDCQYQQESGYFRQD